MPCRGLLNAALAYRGYTKGLLGKPGDGQASHYENRRAHRGYNRTFFPPFAMV